MLVPVSLITLLAVLCLTPLWKELISHVPATSWLRDVAELSPVAVIFLSGFAAEFLAEKVRELKRRTLRLVASEEGLEFHEPGRHLKLAWSDVTQVSWDSDPGRHHQSYLVTEIAGNSKRMRISQQFFKKDEVILLYGLAMIHTRPGATQ